MGQGRGRGPTYPIPSLNPTFSIWENRNPNLIPVNLVFSHQSRDRSGSVPSGTGTLTMPRPKWADMDQSSFGPLD